MQTKKVAAALKEIEKLSVVGGPSSIHVSEDYIATVMEPISQKILTLLTPVEVPAPASASARGLLQRSYRVLRAVADVDPEEPLGRLQRGVLERLVGDIKAELDGSGV